MSLAAGFGQRQIAARLHCSLGAAHSHVAGALAQLRDLAQHRAHLPRWRELAGLDAAEARLHHRLELAASNSDCASLVLAIVKISESRRKVHGLDLAPSPRPPLSCNHTECPLPSSHHGPLNDKPCKAQRTHTG